MSQQQLPGAAPGFAHTDEPDYDDFLVSYHHGDPAASALVTNNDGRAPRSKEEYVKLLARADMEKDTELVSRLAEEVLSKSHAVNDLVSELPGMRRTKAEQMKKIEELLVLNREAAEKLERAYADAERSRDAVRSALSAVTCEALGIEKEGG